MFGFNRMVVAQDERAMVFENRSLVGIQEPGVYQYFDMLGRTQWQIYSVTEPLFAHPQLDVFLADNADLMARYFDVVELAAEQVGLVYRNGRVNDVLAPDTRTLFWKGPISIEVKVLDIGPDGEIPRELARQLVKARDPRLISAIRNTVLPVEIGSESIGLLLVDGELVRTLQPGLYAYWRYNRTVKVEQIDTRVQAMEVAGQEILTRDKVSLRVNLSANYRVVEPVVARQSSVNFIEMLYRALQFALRQAIGTRTLDTLLAGKDELDGLIFKAVVDEIREYGIEIKSVGVKDVILPGEMKDILNKVVEAEKAAQANIIKRREETAATRSLLNTAKLMDQNPVLMRLKELETLEKVTEKVDRLTIFGGLEGVLQDTVKINIDAK